MATQQVLFTGFSAKEVFDQAEAEASKKRGMNAAAIRRYAILKVARAALVHIAHGRPDRCVTADDAQKWLVDNGYSPSELGSAAGSLFCGGDWEFTGRWEKSIRVSNHASDLRVWRLK